MFDRFMDGLSVILIPELGFFFGILTAVFLVVTVTMCVAGLFTRLLDFIASLSKEKLQLKELREQVQVGIDQIERGETIPADVVRERINQRRADK